MKTIGAYAAKTRLSRLLMDVDTRHEAYVIKRRNRNIAWLLPFDAHSETPARNTDYVAGLNAIRKSASGPTDSRSLRDDGRDR